MLSSLQPLFYSNNYNKLYNIRRGDFVLKEGRAFFLNTYSFLIVGYKVNDNSVFVTVAKDFI